jgi:hypothetical protein
VRAAELAAEQASIVEPELSTTTPTGRPLGSSQLPTRAKLRRDWPELITEAGWLAAIFLIAFLMRLLPVLRGAGLLGRGPYDDGVHYSAALALVNGDWPYRDFLLLQPPGVVIALVPFAVLGAATHDGLGFEVARVFWMLLGACTAVLVARLLRRVSVLAAIAGGTFYAVYYPALYTERTLFIECLGSICLIGALLLALPRPARPERTWRYLAAGALLGFAASTKLWESVIVLLVIIWVGVSQRWRVAGLVAVGTATVGTVACLPFLVRAPARMWLMVVRDQLERPANGGGVLKRLPMMVGITGPPPPWLTLSIMVAILLLAALSLRVAPLRIAPALLITVGVMLLFTPSFFFHYAGVVGVPLALVVGSGIQVLAGALSGVLRPGYGFVGLVAGVAIAALAITPLSVPYGRVFPVQQFAGPLAELPGCVTADDPLVLVELDVFTRNVRRGCPVVVDLGGYSYHLSRGVLVARQDDPVFQAAALRYLSSGSATLVVRFTDGIGLSQQTRRVIAHWPKLATADRYAVRRPLPNAR